MVVYHEYLVYLTQFNTCPPYFNVEYKIICDFAVQCSMNTLPMHYAVWFGVLLCVISYLAESNIKI